jgi:hypothetical protein
MLFYGSADAWDKLNLESLTECFAEAGFVVV